MGPPFFENGSFCGLNHNNGDDGHDDDHNHDDNDGHDDDDFEHFWQFFPIYDHI